ncbi:hypothetical protein J6TS2_26180 [Heyndrickxia sporothermodurans]|nr:hypothetical protein J6TS2_26180 [Heyndrickxia sporothermodurans]
MTSIKKIIIMSFCLLLFFCGNEVSAKSEISISKTSGNYTVTASTLNVRSGPSTKYKIVGTLFKNNKITVTGKTSNGWFRFTYKNKNVYVSGNYVKKETVSALTNVAKTKTAKKTNQIVTVVGKGSAATVEYWSKNKTGKWVRVFTTKGHVGSKGVGKASESDSRTPKGAYKLGFAFGTTNPKTNMTFKRITKNSYWISNVNDPKYNTWQERTKSSKLDEHLIKYPTQYKYAMVINYNTYQPKKGAGSAIFLHVDNGKPTAGCVSILEKRMLYLINHLTNNAYIIIVNKESEIAKY